MKYLSVCAGIEAASVAWHCLGWEPLALSEIEAFPRAVLAHHYPGVPLHGDFTKLRDDPWIVDADVLVGGTPCQAFSVAGLRRSLDDDRGNLSLEYVRLADAIDASRSAAGKQPAIIVWENVPGVLSVKDNAFGCFLAALAGDVAPYVPPRGKWTDAGVVAGPQRTVAWRILDAQYFGLAQRRRRVFVVASAREGFDPAAVLLECEGVRRDTPPRREAGQGTARGIEIGPSGGRFTDLNPTLDTRAKDGPIRNQLAGAVMQKWPADLAPTLNAHFGENQGLEDQHIRGGQGYLSPPISRCLNAGGMGRQDWETETFIPTIGCVFDEVAHTLKGEGFNASEDGTGRGTPLVPVTVWTLATNTGPNGHDAGNFASNQAVDAGYVVPVILDAVAFYANEGSLGSGNNAEISPTLKAHPKTSNLAAVAYSIMPQNSGKDYKAREVEVAQPIMAGGPVGGNQGGDYIMQPVAFAQNTRDEVRLQGGDGQIVGALAAEPGMKQTTYVAQSTAYAFQPRIARNGRGDMGEIVNALNAQSGETGKGDAAPCVAVADTLGVGSNQTSGFESEVVAASMAVRRLTPVECERLQGFPDGYTLIPWRNKPAADCPDGPRYKALGNSMAVPCMRWIGLRIVQHLKDAT